MFQRIDANKDGRIGWDEAWGFVQRRFGEADRDQDGGLTLAEMQAMRMMGGRPDGGRAERPGQDANPGPDRGPDRSRFAGMMFRAVDANRDGRVTLEEVRPMVEARFRSFDANGDNAVSRDEVPQPRRDRAPRGGDRGAPAPEGPAPATPR